MAMIGVQTGGLTRLYGIDGAYRTIRDAGFDAADVNLDELLAYREILDQSVRPYSAARLRKAGSGPIGTQRKNTALSTPRPTRLSPPGWRTLTGPAVITIICCT